MHRGGNPLDRFGTQTLTGLGISHNKVHCLVVELALELQSGHQVNHLHPPARRPPAAYGGADRKSVTRLNRVKVRVSCTVLV